MSDITLEHLSADRARPLLGQLVAVYVGDVYADDPVFSDEARFRQQLTSHMTQPGWEMVTARVGEEIVGYIYGFTLTPTNAWWNGLVSDVHVPHDFTEEDGTRTFAISELLVRAPWRRRGIATAMHDALVEGRTEERATLLVQPTYTSAHAAYAKWGWRKVARLQPTWPNAPLYDVLLLQLPPPSGTRR